MTGVVLAVPEGLGCHDRPGSRVPTASRYETTHGKRRRLQRRLLSASRHGSVLAALTAREHDVLALMAEGRSNSAIADRLYVSERAVEKHISNIFSKLGLPPSDSSHRRVLAVLAYLGDG